MSTAEPADETALAAKVAALSTPRAYPEHPAAVQALQTHMSWVFLTPAHVYKLKKPFRRSFIDLSTLAARRHNCLEEVRLNRRLAPETYLGVRPLVVDRHGVLRLADQGQVVDWLVHMQRLPAERMLDALIAENGVTGGAVAKLAERLIRFYRETPAESGAGTAYRTRYTRYVRENAAELADPLFALPRPAIERLSDAQLGFLGEHAGIVEQRATTGLVREVHGDLRPQHICLLDPPVIIDCLEFRREFRQLDPVDELAFLAIECQRLGAEWIGIDLLARFRRATGDATPPRLVAFYQCYRACLRARLVVWHLRDQYENRHHEWRKQALAYLAMAEDYAAVMLR